MARKARQRISYVLPLANNAGGHRLGVNGLAVDANSSTLYSGGRDGVICAWDLHIDLRNTVAPEHDAKLPPAPASNVRQQVQAHTHWINDIALAHSNQALVSASSDITVKLWRPAAADGLPPQPIGLHSDYVKTLAVPSATCDWVASGGLDRKINLWDLNGHGQRLSIDVCAEEATSLRSTEKGSVYALAATDTVLASGGPEGTVRVWDCRTGKRVTKLVGHTDNIRDILISQDGSTILTASSDRTVKAWSTIVGRCMFTLTMHDASVWSLFSSHPDLSVFHSSDKNGLIVRTDTRNTIELDEGLSLAVAQEHEGVHKVVTAGDCIWTATSRPSINRWRDVNTDNAEIDVPENYTTHRLSSATARSRYPSPPNLRDMSQPSAGPGNGKRKIPLRHMLRLSNTAFFPTPLETGESRLSLPGGNFSESPVNEASVLQPVRSQPDYSIEGQNGLIKHEMLNDRKRVLTLDTAGEVVMWDLLKCVPIRSYGKRHLEDVKEEMTTTATVANWCTVNTRTGSVAVILEENTAFDAEIYADELDLDPGVDYREDQRINLGKWVLRYLCDSLISEEIRRDQVYRSNLLSNRELKLQRENAPTSIRIPQTTMNSWNHGPSETSSLTTPRPHRIETSKAISTPGFNIGIATPGSTNSPMHARMAPNFPSTVGESALTAEPPASQQSPQRTGEGATDYFSTLRTLNATLVTPGSSSLPAATPSEGQDLPNPSLDGPPRDATTPGKEGIFGKKFRVNMSFSGMKKIGRTQTNEKPAPVEEKEETESDSRSSKTSNSRIADDSFFGTIQKIRFAYEDSLQEQLQAQQTHENGLPVARSSIELPTAITPSQSSDTPVLRPPPNTIILIQEDRPEAGGVADLFEGTVGALGDMSDLVEKAAPMWLGEVLLRNQLPPKDIIKISFILEPWQGLLPNIASDGNNRLNANRMLRARKILGYVAERIEPGAPNDEEHAAAGEKIWKPEEYLELWCQNQLVPPTMTLMTIRAHLWKGGGDVVLYYKANGKKTILHQPLQQLDASQTGTAHVQGGEAKEAA